MGWGMRAAGGVDVHVLSIQHNEMLREPHVEILGTSLSLSSQCEGGVVGKTTSHNFHDFNHFPYFLLLPTTPLTLFSPNIYPRGQGYHVRVRVRVEGSLKSRGFWARIFPGPLGGVGGGVAESHGFLNVILGTL